MPTYVNLVKWTDQGIKNYKDSPSRAADFAKLVESLGGRVRELLWTAGEYDLVAIIEFPDDETGVAAGLRVGSLGSIRTTTMRAFGADEMSRYHEGRLAAPTHSRAHTTVMCTSQSNTCAGPVRPGRNDPGQRQRRAGAQRGLA